MAMMMARLYTGHHDILCLRNAYHGLSGGAGAVGGGGARDLGGARTGVWGEAGKRGEERELGPPVLVSLCCSCWVWGAGTASARCQEWRGRAS